MKNKTRLVAALVLTGTMIGGIMVLYSGSSAAGLKDDSCWDPKQVNVRDQIHSRNCLTYGRIEPNNADRGASQPASREAFNGGGGARGPETDPTPPTDQGPSGTSGPGGSGPSGPGDSGPTGPGDSGPTGPGDSGPTGPGDSGPTGPGDSGPTGPDKKPRNNRGFGNGEEFGCKGNGCFGNENNNPGKGKGTAGKGNK